MALSQIKKDKLKELELNRSGVAFVSEKSHVKPNPTIIISLGGLGGKTTNMLKGKFEREIGESDKVFFRVLDTDVDDTDKICKIKKDGTKNSDINAHMDAGETISLYDPIINQLLFKESIPQNIKAWLNPTLIGTPLKNDGAQQIRQIGRAMLVNDTVYHSIKNKFHSVINTAIAKANEINGNVDVIVIAGISGGTGSGTIIDVPYMIHDIFNSLGFNKYTLAGYIYTPDAQFEVEGIKNDENIKLNLQTNGYSALKEIDYFMNVEETGSNYHLKLGVGEVNSNRNIFSTCTLISGYSETGGINSLDVTMGRLTDQLMDMLTDISFVDAGGQPVQLARSLLSNASSMLKAWFVNHPNRKDFHRYASYKYQVLGYNAIKIPRDEILAYCVNKIYENVLTEFMNFKNVNKAMMDQIYSITSIDNIVSVRQMVLTLNPQDPIVRNIVIEEMINKKMVKNNPMYGYGVASNYAGFYAQKITNSFRGQFEQRLFEELSKQIDQIFNTYGPYVALKAIKHQSIEKGIGDPNDAPFSGIEEQLINLSNQFKEQAKKAKNTFANGGQQKVMQLASSATGFTAGKKEMNEYKATCANLAVITLIDGPLYDMVADGLYNVSVEINRLNNEIFDVYTSVLTEIQKILNQDGQYFAKSSKETIGNTTHYSVNILASGQAKASRLEKYLESFISTVSVQELAQNFIKTMRENREKWIAQNNEDDFDVVSEVRELMDQCLTHNNMKSDIIEKFVAVAYNNEDITAEELDTIWADNTPDSPKMQALNTAAWEIYNALENGAKTLAQSTDISFKQFTSQIYIGTLADTPLLSEILAKLIQSKGSTPATSNAKNKFIVTQRYVNLPMYILKGMEKFDEQYSHNPSAGRHMDENHEYWGRFPNPYTIDSVAKDISARNEVPEMIQDNSDYKFLTKIKEEVDLGIDNLHSIDLSVNPLTNQVEMKLMDIVKEPDLDVFKAALIKKIRRNQTIDLIPFMKENGYLINEIQVNIGDTDINLGIRDLEKDVSGDEALKYEDLPVPIADMYKWIRKSIKYTDIIEKNIPKFQAIQETIEEIKKQIDGNKQFIDSVETFAFCLRTGLVKQKATDKNIWNYMNGKDPVTVNLNTAKSFDRKYYLYNVFARFAQMEPKRIAGLKRQAVMAIEAGNQVDYDLYLEHIKNILSDEVLGDPFNWEEINDDAFNQGIAEKYNITDLELEEPDPVKDLTRFYKLILTNME